jgi:AraC-like DNA-binding protein/ligand-binding sensor protein
MKPPGIEDLRRLPVLRDYQEAFCAATGMSFSLAAPDEPGGFLPGGPAGNAFCALVASTHEGCVACRETHSRLRRGLAAAPSPQAICCFAGLMVAAVPVVVGGRHVATLISGRVLRQAEGEDVLKKAAGRFGKEVDDLWEERARKARVELPVVTAERFHAMVYLLSTFARYLADQIARMVFPPAREEPGPVLGAKRFVESHLEEPLVVNRAMEHVRVNRYYFCKLFKKTTGMTLTEYVTRVRVEKAKALLVDTSLRVTDVVYAAGFGSIPRFNSVFKRHVGMAPTQYRATLRPGLTGPSAETGRPEARGPFRALSTPIAE